MLGSSDDPEPPDREGRNFRTPHGFRTPAGSRCVVGRRPRGRVDSANRPAYRPRMPSTESLQDRYAPASVCFGCGPANPEGLRIKSRVEGDEVVADWVAGPNHEAFPGILNGGIIGTLLDCHSNWTAAAHLMKARNAEAPPVTVTAEYAIKLRRPTPSDRPVHLTARVVESTVDRATVEAELSSGGEVTATCRGSFVAVREGHGAFGNW